MFGWTLQFYLFVFIFVNFLLKQDCAFCELNAIPNNICKSINISIFIIYFSQSNLLN